jgi:hypothetical protein
MRLNGWVLRLYSNLKDLFMDGACFNEPDQGFFFTALSATLERVSIKGSEFTAYSGQPLLLLLLPILREMLIKFVRARPECPLVP